MCAKRRQASHEQGRYCGDSDLQDPGHPNSTVGLQGAGVRCGPLGADGGYILPRCEAHCLVSSLVGPGGSSLGLLTSPPLSLRLLPSFWLVSSSVIGQASKPTHPLLEGVPLACLWNERRCFACQPALLSEKQ